MKHLILLMLFGLATATSAIAQDAIVGTWKTIDDETGKARSHVKIYLAKNGSYYGKIEKLLNRGPEEEQDPYCDECPKDDYRYNQRVIGMIILSKLDKSGDTYSGGTILDPKNGKIYKCKVWAEDENTLKVRGYLGPFFRTQTWYRIDE